MKALPLSACSALAAGLLGFPGAAFAQSAGGFDATGLIPGTPQPTAPAKSEAPAAALEAVELQPSRYVGGELAAYVRDLSARFSIRSRQTDPFGKFQDPDYIPAQPAAPAASPLAGIRPAEPALPFADVISGISVNTVIPARQQFLIGNRSFRTNQVMSLRLPNGKDLKAKVVSVSSSRIRFANVTTGETADLVLNLMPPGMSKGAGTITAPGMEALDSSAPVEIQPVIPLSNNQP